MLLWILVLLLLWIWLLLPFFDQSVGNPVVDAKERPHPALEVLKDASGTALGHVHHKNGQRQVLRNG